MTLKLESVTKNISGKRIVSDLNFQVKKGEILALIGPSGCGKSTTLRLISGLDKLSQGKILINNKDITKEQPSKRNIAMVFQSYALFPHLSVYRNLELGLKIRNVSRKNRENRIRLILSTLQLEDCSERKPSQLSGGQRQRVALGRALLRDPSAYLLDEPMSNLDAQLRDKIRPQIKTLLQDSDKPIVYVTHDQKEAMGIASRICILNQGSIQQIGTPQELYSKPNSLFVAQFIGRPEINVFNLCGNETTAIRPEHLIFDDKGASCKLTNIEWQGSQKVLILKSDLGNLRMICNSNEVIPDSIKISWDKTQEIRFDTANGLRL